MLRMWISLWRESEPPGKVLQQITERLLSLGSLLKRLNITPESLSINTAWE